VGAVIRAYRKAAGLSQQELADFVGISRATLSYLESDRDIEVGAAKLLSLLDLLGIPIALPAGVDRKHDEHTVDHALRGIGTKAKAKTTRRALDEALATGRVPAGGDGPVRVALDRLGPTECTALVRCVVASSGQPAKAVWRNLRTVATAVDAGGWARPTSPD